MRKTRPLHSALWRTRWVRALPRGRSRGRERAASSRADRFDAHVHSRQVDSELPRERALVSGGGEAAARRRQHEVERARTEGADRKELLGGLQVAEHVELTRSGAAG